MSESPVLVTWIAVNNDPFERERDGTTYRLVHEKPVAGPMLSVLDDKDSPYSRKISDVVLLHREVDGKATERERRAVEETLEELKRRDLNVRIHHETWQGDDPTDHGAIFEFMTQAVPRIRRRYAGRELLLHVSPGTPSMHTIWVLMAATGFVEPPFKLVKSYRESDRRGQPSVVPVELNIETFYKVYRSSRPRQVSSDEQGVSWDPALFQTDAMKRLFVEARRFAQINVPVLILGERGTGKTTLATWIRLHSPFRKEKQDKCWPAVACGQYTAETMRSELFGYKKGAFTGAVKDVDGLLATANGDTLFLDEVGDVSRDLQRLLIKAVEEKEYVSLGSSKPTKSAFRLLTATNVEQSELRERLNPDFLDRISLVTLRLPPLREIRDELAWLWPAIYAQAKQRAGVKEAVLDSGQDSRVVAALAQHPLPGNLRDLLRVAYRIVAALADPFQPLSAGDAADYGLSCLDEDPAQPTSGSMMARAVARAFSDAQPLEIPTLEDGGLPTATVVQEVRAYMAAEVRRAAKSRGLPAEDLCDVSSKTLGNWLRATGLAD